MKKYILIIIATVVMLFSSCSKNYFETYPTTAIAEGTALSTEANINQALFGVYRLMNRQAGWASQGYCGFYHHQFIDDVMGGVVVYNIAGGWGSQYDQQYARTGADNAWEQYYTWRMLFEYIREVNPIAISAGLLNTPTANHYKAEGLALRAYFYYTLAVRFATRWVPGEANTQLCVPLKLDMTMEPMGRNTLVEIMTQVEKDLVEAIALFKASPVAHVTDRANLPMAELLLARLYMYQHKFAEALPLAESVMTRGQSFMGMDAYYGGFNSIENQEWIFGNRQIATDNATYFWSGMAYVSSNFDSSQIRQRPLAIDISITNYIPDTDTRKIRTGPEADGYGIFLNDSQDVIDANMDDNSVYYFDYQFTPTPFKYCNVYSGMSRKYKTTDVSGEVAGNSGAGDMVFMRLAEAYYIAAEAALELGQNTKAAGYIAATITPYDDTYVAKTTKEDITQDLYFYKWFDLYLEGRSWEDAKRRGQIVDRARPGTNHDIDECVVTSYGPLPGQPLNNAFLFLVPENAKRNNPLLKQ